MDELHTLNYANDRTSNSWLNHNSTARTNTAVAPTELVYRLDAAEAKRPYTL